MVNKDSHYLTNAMTSHQCGRVEVPVCLSSHLSRWDVHGFGRSSSMTIGRLVEWPTTRMNTSLQVKRAQAGRPASHRGLYVASSSGSQMLTELLKYIDSESLTRVTWRCTIIRCFSVRSCMSLSYTGLEVRTKLCLKNVTLSMFSKTT